nr:retrovirus-related Pol polyprotein from transposon TNT 1-94 [Tanacetum cinerariifolium]
MGYEKPSIKLTFYKAFFSTQWKFFIHTILHSLSTKRTSWNEFSSTIESAVICLSSGQKFNFLNYIFESLVRNVDSSSKFYMYPRFIQLIIQTNIADLSTHTTRYISPALTQKGDDVQEPAAKEVVTEVVPPTLTPPSPPSLVILSLPPHQPPCPPQPQDAEVPSLLFQHVLDTCSALVRIVEGLEKDKAAQQLEIVKLKARVKKLEKINMVKSSKLKRLKKVGTSQRVESSNDMMNVFNQGRIIADMDQDEGIELVADQEKDVEVEGRHADKQADLYNLDLDHSSKVLSMQEDDTEVQEDVEIVTTAKLMTEILTAAATQVVAASTPIPTAKPKILSIAVAPAVSIRRRKGVLIRDPEEELPSDTVAETPKVKDKGKGILIEAPKPIKKKDQIEMDAEEEIEEEDEEIIKSINETPAQKAAKRRKLHEQAKEDEDLKKQLEVVDDEDDDVFIEATPIGRKVPIVDSEIVPRWENDPGKLGAAPDSLRESLKKYGMETCKPADTLIVEKSKLDEDPQAKIIDPTRYRGMISTLIYPKNTSGSMQLLSDRLVSWSSKKQKSTAISSTKAQHIALSGCCAQILWMRSQLTDYGLMFNKIPLYCDNKIAIALSCNNVQHFRSKHIDVRHHFIKEQVENGVVELYLVRTEYQLADIFTKPLA